MQYTKKAISIGDYVSNWYNDINCSPIGQRLPVTEGSEKRDGIINTILQGIDIGQITIAKNDNDPKYEHDSVDGGHRKRYIHDYKTNKFKVNGKFFKELTQEEYNNAPLVADPLCRYDCVPVVAGAYAIIISRNPNERLERQVRIRSFEQSFNYENQEGDGTTTGISTFKDKLFKKAKLVPEDIGVLSIYDDYPAIVLAQLNDLGIIKDEKFREYLEHMERQTQAVNTWGGMLSAGQPGGMAGGLNGIGEVVLQLQNRAGERQLNNVNFGIATGYGMTLYRHGGTVAATILEAI